MCTEGYTVYEHTGGMCLPLYSGGLPNCIISSHSTCSVCEEGYIRNNDGMCQKLNKNVSCKINGCAYCLEDSVCSMCDNGYHWVYVEKES